MLLGRSQDSLEPDHDQIVDQMGANILGTPTHVLQLESTHALANGSLDLTLRLHGDLQLPMPPQRDWAGAAPQCDQAGSP